MTTSDNTFNGELLSSIFRTSKKTIQEYVREIERNNRYRSVRGDIESGYILDDRSKLIDLYDACLQQDAHIRSVIETLESQILGDRYMLARVNEKGKYIKDVQNTQKIQGSQFDKIIKGIVESKLYGYTLLEIMPTIDPKTGKLAEVNSIERRNVLPDQKAVLKRQGIWEPHWDLRNHAYQRNYGGAEGKSTSGYSKFFCYRDKILCCRCVDDRRGEGTYKCTAKAYHPRIMQIFFHKSSI